MNARDELLDSLMAERYDNRWWSTRDEVAAPDDEVTTARRRRLLAEDFERGSQEARNAV